jgi:tRNA(Arg) A34 adenosine deaminase TadA
MATTKDTIKLLRERIISDNGYLKDGRKFYVTAATLDKRGRIIAIGDSSPVKTHPLMKRYCHLINKYKIYLHAEISALVKSHREVDSLIVVRVNKHKQIASAKPCPICMAAIRDAKVRIIYYTCEGGIIRKERIW